MRALGSPAALIHCLMSKYLYVYLKPRKMNLRIGTIAFMALSSCFFTACKNNPDTKAGVTPSAGGFSVQETPWGTVDDKPITLYTLTAPNGFTARITNYGATLVSLMTQDKSGDFGDVILGFDSLSGYQQAGNPYFGCTVGRYANRIAGATFSLGGKTYTLAANNNGNTLHGGLKGFDKVVWQGIVAKTDSTVSLRLAYISPDGEEGYPGTLKTTVTYTLDQNNGLEITYWAMTDKPTPVNLTNHSYFNLGAGKAGDILGHELQLASNQYTPVNEGLIPTGEIVRVEGSAFNFSTAKKIGKDLSKVPGGYDHNFILDAKKTNGLDAVATLYHPQSGRYMEMATTEPAVQFYSGNFLDGSLKGRGGKSMTKHYGLCLEAQHYPDSPNQPKFPNVILNPGETYTQKTVYRFSVK